MASVLKCLESSEVGCLHIKWKFQLLDISNDISLIILLIDIVYISNLLMTHLSMLPLIQLEFQHLVSNKLHFESRLSRKIISELNLEVQLVPQL